MPCTKTTPAHPVTNYNCLRTGIGIGLNKKLPKNFVLKDKKSEIFCGKKIPIPANKKEGSPLACLRKGFDVGQRLRYERKYETRENFIDLKLDRQNWIALAITLIVMLVVFGLLFMMNVNWIWSLLIGFVAGGLFWYFCALPKSQSND